MRSWKAAGIVAGSLVVAGGLSAAGYHFARVHHNGGRKLCEGWVDPLMLERLAGRDCDPMLLLKASQLPGGPHAVAPATLVDVTRQAYHAPNARLRGIEVPRVRPSGLVDFQDAAYLGVVSVHLDHLGGVFDFEGMHHGFEGDGPLVDDPRCALGAVWAATRKAGVSPSPDEVASITYKALPSGRAGWIFEQGGRKLYIDDATCEIGKDLDVPRLP